MNLPSELFSLQTGHFQLSHVTRKSLFRGLQLGVTQTNLL